VHDGAKIIIAAGFLLGGTVKQYAQQYPNIKFAITDDISADIGGFKNTEGITYATQEGGCLVGVLAAKMAQKMGKKKIAGRRRPEDPAGRHVHRGLQILRGQGRQGHDDDRAVLQQLHRRAGVLEPRAERGRGRRAGGLPGRPAPAATLHSRRRRSSASGASASTRTSTQSRSTSSPARSSRRARAVFQTVVQASKGNFKGGKNLVFNLKNNGVGVGKISPKVKPSWIKLMNTFKSKIIHHKLKIPTTVK